MRLAVVGLASSHVDQIVRLAEAGRLGPARIGALIAPESEPVDDARAVLFRDRAVPGDQFDAALITTRDPATHRALAEPWLRAGVPVFVDKPFVADPADAVALVEAGRRAGALLTSSSALRWHPAVRVAAARWRSEGEPVTVRVSGPADPTSPYGGRAFLGVHAVEAALGALSRGAGASVEILRVADEWDRRVARIRVGQDHAVIELGAFEGWRLSGPGVDTALVLDEDYLRPGLLAFVEAVGQGRAGDSPTGQDLIDGARVLAAVCD